MNKIIFTCLCLLLSILTFANGDPTDEISALIGSGNPTPRKITNIQLVSEKLYVHLGYYSDVTVRYVLWNNSDSDYTNIDYAFPVDYNGGGEKYVNSRLIGDYYTESTYTLGWHDDYIKNISFFIDGEELTYKHSEEEVLKKPKPINKKDYFQEDTTGFSEEGKKSIFDEEQEQYKYDSIMSKIPDVSRRWFYTQFSIKARQSVTLEVHYSLRNNQRRAGYFPLFEKNSGSRCSLNYDFSPAQYWGDGKVWDFSLQIDVADLAIAPDFYANDYSISIEGLPLVRDKNIYSYSTQNFVFKDAAPLKINYFLINNVPVTDILNCIIPKEKYTITASSEQKNYPVSNLTDGNVETAWVVSVNSGIGEKVIINFKQPTKVSDLLIINGYHKNKKTYLENNRVQKIAVSVEGIREGWYGKMYNDKQNDELTFEADNNYQPISFECLKQHPDVSSVMMIDDDTFKVTKIELTIENITRGTKYDDTCISEIMLFDYKKFKLRDDILNDAQ